MYSIKESQNVAPNPLLLGRLMNEKAKRKTRVRMKLPIRSQVIAPPGYVLFAMDLSKAETWVTAHYANERNMKRELREGCIHSFTARAIYSIADSTATKKNGKITEDQYFIGKKSNHANSYRQGYLMYTESVNSESDKPPFITISTKEGKRHHEIWNNTFFLTNWWLEIEDKLKRDHYLINAYGRKRYFWDPISDKLFKAATASQPQGTVADHFYGHEQKENPIPGGLLQIFKQIVEPSLTRSGEEIRMVNTAHDSLICEVPEKMVQDVGPKMIKLMERPMVINGEEFTIPVEAEYGDRWSDGMEKFKI